MAIYNLELVNGLPVLVGQVHLESPTGTFVDNLIALVDTGTDRTIMGCAVEELLQLGKPDRNDVTEGFNEGVPTRLYDNIKIKFLEGEEFKITVGCTGQNLFRKHCVHMIIGMNIINKGILTINHEKSIYTLGFPNRKSPFYIKKD